MRIRRRTAFPRGVFVSGVLGMGLAFGAFYLNRHADPPPEFQSAEVSRGTLERVVAATGQVTPRLKAELTSPISSTVTEVLVAPGTPVKAGEVLARLDPATYQTNVR